MFEQSQQDPGNDIFHYINNHKPYKPDLDGFRKPTNQDVLIWTKESLCEITLGENAFFNTILRDYDFKDYTAPENVDFEDLHPQEEDDYDLILEEDYDCEPL